MRIALISPCTDEPAGIEMMEAMLVGTPVVAFARGCAGELIEDDVTGYVVRDEEEMTARLRSISSFDRQRCQARARDRFGAMRMPPLPAAAPLPAQEIFDHPPRSERAPFRSGEQPRSKLRDAG